MVEPEHGDPWRLFIEESQSFTARKRSNVKILDLLEVLPRLLLGYAVDFLGDDKWLIERLCIDCDLDIKYWFRGLAKLDLLNGLQ